MTPSDKKAFRSMMRAAEAEWAGTDSGAADGLRAGETEAVWRTVEAMPEFRDADTVLLYMSIPGEVGTGEFIRRWYGHKRIVLPLVCGETLELKEFDPQKIRPGYRGILEPLESAISVNPSEVDFAAVPGVAFTEDCMRLGRGGGFYDRLLPVLDCPCVGVCHSFRLVRDIPVDVWDAPLDAVVAAGNLYRRS